MREEEPAVPDPVELTHRVYASLNARDFDSVVGMFAPAGVWDVSRWGLGTHAGSEAIGRLLHDWFGNMDQYWVQVEDVDHLGGGVVYVTVVQTARPAGRHSVLRVRSAPVFVWVDGQIRQVTLYPDIDEARRAAERLAKAAPQAVLRMR
jgi:ketosteroid isomerase-like protein